MLSKVHNMATGLRGLSSYDRNQMPDASGMKFGIVVSEWNNEITYALRDGALDTLLKLGTLPDDISVIIVPGSFELTFGAKLLADTGSFDAVICLGCVIQGETKHFDYICQSVTQGITSLNLSTGIPVIFGVLTTNNIEQARDRAGGKHGNKGEEAAVTAIKMVALKKGIRNV